MPWESSLKLGLSIANKSKHWSSGSAVEFTLVWNCDSKFASDCWEALLDGVGKETGRISTGIDLGAAEEGRSDDCCPDLGAVLPDWTRFSVPIGWIGGFPVRSDLACPAVG